jgi:uncharacterized protein (TIGR03437 family)
MRISGIVLLLAFAAQAQTVDVAGRISDLDYIATQIPRLDPYFFVHLNRADFQQAVDTVSTNIPTLSDAEFYVALAQLVAMAGDAHTDLYLVNSFPLFPLLFRWLDDGVYVTVAASQYARALGSRLVAIGGMSIDDVALRLATVISHENEHGMRSTAERYLRSRITLEGLNIIPPADTADLTFRTLAGEEFTLQVGTEPGAFQSAPDWSAGFTPDYLQGQSIYYWGYYSAANRLLYFKYNLCADAASNPFSSFAAGFLRLLDTNAVDTLVFDFRGNPGGNNMVIQPLLDGLRQRLPRLLSNPDFRVYVALDKGSFSAAVDNAMKLENPLLAPGFNLTGRIQTIGEAPGQAPSMYGNTVPFSLPVSHVGGWYATRAFPHPLWIPDGPELAPDIPVPVNSTDFFARFDPVMAAILARSTGTARITSGDVVTANGASLRTAQGIVPGSFATAFGSFATVPDEVQVSGIPSGIVAATRGQVNFIVPDNAPVGVDDISIRAAGVELARGKTTISADGPGVFTVAATDPAQPGAVENEDNSVNSSSNPAATGSIVQIFATGCGARDAMQAYFGDTPAQVVFSGAVSSGLCPVNVSVPDKVSGQTPVFLIQGHVTSNAVTVWVRGSANP